LPLVDFADMDRDGMADLVYYDQNMQSIMTFYNRMKANSPSELNLCKATVHSVSSYLGEANRFFAPLSSTKSAQDVDVQPIDNSKYLPTLVETADGMPGRIRLGDINADGFPDILMTLSTKNNTKHSVIMLNMPGSSNQMSPV
jgi:hypothetical protein